MNAVTELLLVEDNPGDVRLIEEALRENAIEVQLHVASDGLQALDFLHRRGVFAAATTPDLILLDLNLPRMDGLSLLAALKSDPALARIPAVVLTTSACDRDIERVHDLGARCFVTKPVDFEAFVAVVMHIVEEYWPKPGAPPAG